jgi:protein-tyrosine-phosphatase
VRVLFVCTANVCRSRVAEEVFQVLAWTLPGRKWHDARSAGTHPQAGGRRLTEADVEWADVVCVMEPDHAVHIRAQWPWADRKIRVLGIPDVYSPSDATLRDLLATHIRSLLAEASPGGTRSVTPG